MPEAGHDVLTEHHPVPTLRGELQGRQDKGRPLAINEILQVFSCLGPLLTLVQQVQMLVELYLSLTASGDLAE
ncbi:MAG: hypothetical protein AUH01_01840 [Acidobacteria bacterium 13_2_20CM_56_17]|nr:MAG: hypothetical protein AUH01_01840 [Acidobacteria bacterium 13_2_20CM_56_17]